jgi:hypothetical protein
MNLRSVKLARSIWLVNYFDLNPHGISLFPHLSKIGQKYMFQVVPTKPDELDLTKGVLFRAGTFQNENRSIAFDLTVYNDGLVVDTRSSTNDSDLIIDEYLTWLSTEMGLAPYKGILKSKLYLSELWVQTDKALNSLNPKLDSFAKRLTTSIVGRSHQPLAFEASGIIFWTDPTVMVNPPGPFRFEREENAPFGEHRYYSSAPLQTDVHLKLLEELENILS